MSSQSAPSANGAMSAVSSGSNQSSGVGTTNYTAGSSTTTSASLLSDVPTTATPLSTIALQNKLRLLRQESQKDSQLLTQKLASSQSGQNLLHIGTSLSTLPPDLHSLLQHLHPILSAAETSETEQLEILLELVSAGKEIRLVERRIQHAAECADLYADLLAAEQTLQHPQAQQAQNQLYKTSSSSNASTSHARRVDFVDPKVVLSAVERGTGDDDGYDDEDEDHILEDEDAAAAAAAAQLDYALSLERAAHITLCLVQDLQSATQTVSTLTSNSGSNVASSADGTTNNNNSSSTSKHGDKNDSTKNTTTNTSMLPTLHSFLPQDAERAQFLMKLAPRIRRVEADTARCLGAEFERLLQVLRSRREADQAEKEDGAEATASGEQQQQQQNDQQQQQSSDAPSAAAPLVTNNKQCSQDDLLLMLGHVMRGLALLGRGREVESIFARVAIMPLIRSEVSMGRLDEGGARGECAGLFSLLDNMAESIYRAFAPVLRLAEAMFDVSCSSITSKKKENLEMDVDLITAGVWVPISTALMADAGIKMAIFSPGIASILQANYCALDTFLSELAERLLKEEKDEYSVGTVVVLPGSSPESSDDYSLMYRPTISKERRKQAQDRIYTHHKTAEFSKKWNLPIYYQLRFGDCCTRLNKAIEQTQREGWIATVFDGSSEQAETLKQQYGFELSLFLELYEILLSLWRPDVILRPLANRFLRGSVQLVGRLIAFVGGGLDGSIKFGADENALNGGVVENGSDNTQTPAQVASYPTRSPYCWGDSEEDVAAVAWEMTIMDSTLRHDYVDTVCKAIRNNDSTQSDMNEIRVLVSEVMKEAADQIQPLIEKAWNDVVVKILTSKCSAPLAAVKGVAATYRMTNRPPPTQASPFVSTILRPLSEFINEFKDRMPDQIGSRWKHQIVATVSDRYSAAVEDLIATVKRTEEALSSRRSRRTVSGGLSDGAKVKLQLYLDYQMFAQSVAEVGVEQTSVIGLNKLRDLTLEGEALRKQ